MHRAKGLEFDSVFIIGASSSEIPTRAALRTAVDDANKREIIERERSLIHVAATRAKKQLTVTWSGERSALFKQE